MVLVTFPERKVTRLPGRDPATQNITWAREWGTRVQSLYLPGESSSLPSLIPPSRIAESVRSEMADF